MLEGASWTEKQVLFISLSGWEYDGREFLTYFGTNLNIPRKKLTCLIVMQNVLSESWVREQFKSSLTSFTESCSYF